MLRNNCNCGCNNVQSCTCKISTTTSNCNSTCTPMVSASNFCVAVPNPPAVPSLPNVSANPTVTVESLLTLIEVKCDKTMCKKLQTEIDALYVLLQAVKPVPVISTTPTVPGGTTPTVPTVPVVTPPIAIPPVAFQLIADMTESLSGDLTNLYPSAEMLKIELRKLWKCLSDKQQHHGKWVNNFTYRDILHQAGDECVTSLSPTTANTIKVITPVDVGSTVFNTIEGKECLFESLVDNNVTEPTKLSVLDGLWINYCDIRAVIDCVLPRTKITDCHQACDDPNQDGVFEDRTMCERVACVEAQICDTECVAGQPTLCERVVTNALNIANAAAAIIVNAANIATNTANITTNTTDIATNAADITTNTADIASNDTAIATNTTAIANMGNNDADITKLNGCVFPSSGHTVCERLDLLEEALSLPSGAQTFVSSILGTFDVIHKTSHAVEVHQGPDSGGNYFDIYEFECNSMTLSPTQYHYLKVAGRKLVLSGNASVGYFTDVADKTNLRIGSLQWGTRVYIDGVLKKTEGDMYGCNRSGDNSGHADNFSLTITTTGHPIVIKFCYVASFTVVNGTGGVAAHAGDTLSVDMGSSTITFTGEELV